MHKLPQPVKLWYLSSFFRCETPAGRPLPAVLAGRGGGDRLGRPGGRRRGDPAAGGAAGGDRGARRQARARLARPAGEPRRVSRGADRLPARQRGPALGREVVERIDLNPLRAFDAKHEPTQRVMAKAPRLIDRLPQEDLDHFAEVQDLLRAADLTYTVDTTLVRGLDYYTRTLFEFQSGALEAAQNTLGRRRPLRRPGRGARRAADARRGLGGGRRADADGLDAGAAGRAGRRPVRRLRAGPQGGGVQARRRRAPGRATAQDSNSPGAASRASSSRRRASVPATLPSSATTASSFATATAVRTSSSLPKPSCTTSGGTSFETTTREPVPRRLGR